MKLLSTALFTGTALASLLTNVQSLAAATEKTLYSFCSLGSCTDGNSPNGVIDVDGTLYGTTYYGGTGGGCNNTCGAVFSFDLSTNSETVMHSFSSGTDGSNPNAELVDVKGRLYGTTDEGGYYGGGVAFSVKRKNNAETTVVSFGCCSDGYYPSSGMINHKGTLYGTTQSGGQFGQGTVYSLDPKTGTLTVIYSFCSQQNCTDGADPRQLNYVKGILYGTTDTGGANNYGTVFSVDPATGTETVLHSFCNPQNCADGYFPTGKLIYVGGKLYGTTGGGGSYGGGTVFSLDASSGVETVLYSFNSSDNGPWYPLGGVTNVNGTLYGTTSYGGSGSCDSGCGTVFAINLATGTESTVYTFEGNDGEWPDSKLIDVSGTLYGTASDGGGHGGGTIFSITP